jgi:hypothetical protein
MFMPRHQNAGQNLSMNTAVSKSLKNIKYLGMTVTNQNFIHKEIYKDI